MHKIDFGPCILDLDFKIATNDKISLLKSQQKSRISDIFNVMIYTEEKEACGIAEVASTMQYFNEKEKFPDQDVKMDIFSLITKDSGMGLLHIAIESDFTHTALCLIRSGSQINKTDHKNNTPLHYAVRRNNLPVVKELLQTGCTKDSLNKMFESPVHIAVRMGHVDILKELVKQGCDVNAREPVNNITPLHIAVQLYDDFQMFLSVFKILLEGNCVLNFRAYNTLETPVYRAIDMCKTHVAELLLVYGANPNLTSPFGVTTLQKACQRQNKHLVNVLLHCGINKNKEKWFFKRREYIQSEDINYLLARWERYIPTLQECSRECIRTNIKVNLHQGVKKLALPNQLGKYILLSDISYFYII